MYAACGVFVLGSPAHMVAQGGQQTVISDQQVAGANPERAPSSVVAANGTNRSLSAATIEEPASAEPPDSPGAVRAENAAQEQSSSSQSSSSTSTSASSPPEGAQPSESQEPKPKPQRPVGTAAAEAPSVSGITAAQPAGVAIAPAKQHRVRTIVLKVGAILGAGAALGATVALTAGTPSKPPGAH